MNGSYQEVGLEVFAVGRCHARYLVLVTDYALNTFACEHPSAPLRDAVDKLLCDDIASASHAKRALVVEIGDERMGREGCASAFACIEG